MTTAPDDGRAATAPVPRDRSPWNWLLLVPVVLALAVPLYDRTEPRLAGVPFFYWFQLAVIPVGVTCTVLAYRAGRRRRTAGTGAAP
jgi:predicted permease